MKKRPRQEEERDPPPRRFDQFVGHHAALREFFTLPEEKIDPPDNEEEFQALVEEKNQLYDSMTEGVYIEPVPVPKLRCSTCIETAVIMEVNIDRVGDPSKLLFNIAWTSSPMPLDINPFRDSIRLYGFCYPCLDFWKHRLETFEGFVRVPNKVRTELFRRLKGCASLLDLIWMFLPA